jgi:hypothetical protein
MGIGKKFTTKFADYDDPESLALRFRARRMAPLLAMIEAAYLEHGQVQIIDLGGTRDFWRLLPGGLLEAKKIRLLLVNPEVQNLAGIGPHLDYLQADVGQALDFADDSFHIAHSNSVIEHVGASDQVQTFAGEARRLAPAYFVQTPNFWFPLEPHFMTPFFQFLPLRWRAGLLHRSDLGHFRRCQNFETALQTVKDVRLLTPKKFRQLFPDAEIVKERMLCLTKSLVAIRYRREN